MSKIIVNPTLYITCRLCLEDLGVYQIVPEVKEQILFCFGINIDPFDGLPPLICNKCEKAVTQVSEMKKKFLAKQEELKTKISGHNGTAPPVIQVAPQASVPPPKPVLAAKPVPTPQPVLAPPSTSRPEITKVYNHIEENVRKSRSRNTNTSSGQVSDSEDISERTSWKKEYKKKFHCRLCFSSYSNKKYLKVHSAKHKALKAKYRNVFRKYCSVQIPKIDGKPNFTGSDKRVVYNSKKIIENRPTDHYIVYFNGEEHDNRNSYLKIESRCNSSDSSNIDLSIARKRKRRRISSSSSNETVVIDDKNNGDSKLQSGIPIDDSDDETISTSKNKEMLLERIAKETSKDGTIGKIITICCLKYEKSQSDFNVSDNVAMQVKRKILSLGRKIINSKNFNSNVLLKFLQYKNLDIAWLSRSIMHNNITESNFVRIQTRKRNESDKDKIDTNWVDHSPTKEDLQFNYEKCCIGCGTSYATVCVTPILESTSHEQPNEINVTDMSDSAVLSSLLTNDTKKLLNANPVANPKQLPKKCATIEKVSPKITPTPEPEICMPIITSTKSLAEVEKPVADGPRIKVKPASELMSKESLNLLLEPRARTIVNVSQSQPVMVSSSQTVSNIYILPGNVISMSSNITTPTIRSVATMSPLTNTIVSSAGSVTEAPKNTADYIILDTVELPNTKTYSPFTYFKNLLQMHNIILLDPHTELSSEFHCLIRFKVRYNQESCQPLILSLSLHCRQNVFCLKIKGRTQEDIDMSKINANWQWEILKIYKGEVVKKMLEIATKIGQETLEYTSSFLCLLKSINNVSVNS